MALDFLGSIGNIAGTVGQVAGPIAQILQAIRGPEKPQKVKRPPVPESEKYSISLLKALAEPGNSLLKSLMQEELMNLQGGVQSDIRSKVLSDRRERSLGRSNTFFDPERTDENIAFQISRGTPLLRETAQSNAIQRILKAAGVGDFAGAESGREETYQGALGARNEEMARMRQGGLLPTGLERLQTGLGGIEEILRAFQQRGGQEKYGPFQQASPYNQKVYNG